MDENTEARVHVVIVNYRSVGLIEKCLASLLNEPIASVVVLENGSGEHEADRLSTLLQSLPFPTRMVALDENVGFGAGVNRAVSSLEAADEDLLWILNPDTTVESGAVRSLVSEMQERHLDLVSPILLTGDRARSIVWFAGGEYDAHIGRVRHHLQGEELSSIDNTNLPAEFLTGAALMIRVGAWRDMKGFREDLFLYWEDVDLSRRALGKGFRLGVSKAALVWHQVGGSGDSPGRSSAYYRFMARNRYIVAAFPKLPHAQPFNAE